MEKVAYRVPSVAEYLVACHASVVAAVVAARLAAYGEAGDIAVLS